MPVDLYAQLMPVVFGLLGIAMMIVGPSMMVYQLKKNQNINWIMYGMIMFILGLGLMIYFLTS